MVHALVLKAKKMDVSPTTCEVAKCESVRTRGLHKKMIRRAIGWVPYGWTFGFLKPFLFASKFQLIQVIRFSRILLNNHLYTPNFHFEFIEEYSVQPKDNSFTYKR